MAQNRPVKSKEQKRNWRIPYIYPVPRIWMFNANNLFTCPHPPGKECHCIQIFLGSAPLILKNSKSKKFRENSPNPCFAAMNPPRLGPGHHHRFFYSRHYVENSALGRSSRLCCAHKTCCPAFLAWPGCRTAGSFCRINFMFTSAHTFSTSRELFRVA